MTEKLVTIFGGSGFIGRHVVRKFAAAGWRVRVAVRDTRAATFLKPAGDLGQISLMPTSIGDDASVSRAVKDADAVINCVGILYERGARTFERIHVEGARRIAKAATAAGASHLVHISALGADANSPSAYARSKAAGEAAVQEAFPTATILRPAVVFGPEDGFFNLFGRIAQISPVLPFFTDIVPHVEGGGGAKFQPVYVGDVAEAILQSVTVSGHAGDTYELAGPRVYDMREILQIVNHETMRHRWIIGVPYVVAQVEAFFLQFLPKPLLTPDQVKLLKIGSVAHGGKPGLEDFGIAPSAVEGIVGGYLKRYRPVQQTKRLRLSPRNGE
jgi:NADH dehydrogenase